MVHGIGLLECLHKRQLSGFSTKVESMFVVPYIGIIRIVLRICPSVRLVLI